MKFLVVLTSRMTQPVRAKLRATEVVLDNEFSAVVLLAKQKKIMSNRRLLVAITIFQTMQLILAHLVQVKKMSAAQRTIASS